MEALLGLVGLLVGAAIQHLVERGRRAREDRLRWHPDLKAAYSSFLVSTDAMSDVEYSLAMNVGVISPQGLDPGVEVGDLLRWEDLEETAKGDPYRRNALERLAEGLPRSLEVREASLAALTELEFLAAEAVVELAKAFRSRTLWFINTAYATPPRSCGGASEDLVAADAEMQEARAAFVAAVRRDLREAQSAKESSGADAKDPHEQYAHGRHH